jgi:hypothetical protein
MPGRSGGVIRRGAGAFRPLAGAGGSRHSSLDHLQKIDKRKVRRSSARMLAVWSRACGAPCLRHLRPDGEGGRTEGARDQIPVVRARRSHWTSKR